MPGIGSVACPKGPSLYESRKARQLAAVANERLIYAAVTARDESCCRVCGKWSNPRAIGVLYRAHHHHIVYRSQGGETTMENVALICAACHDDEHRGRIRITGNADIREGGKLCGICIERPTDGVWEVVAWR